MASFKLLYNFFALPVVFCKVNLALKALRQEFFSEEAKYVLAHPKWHT